MKHKSILYLLWAAVLFSYSALIHADPETWYFNVGLGKPNPSHSAYVDSFLQYDSHSEISVDLGIYRNLGDYFAAGLALTNTGETTDVYGIDYFTYLTAVSFLSFFGGNEIGDGLFVRADLGAAKAVLHDNYYGGEINFSGTGYLLGVGYGFPLSRRARVLFTLASEKLNMGDDDFSSTNFGISLLW